MLEQYFFAIVIITAMVLATLVIVCIFMILRGRKIKELNAALFDRDQKLGEARTAQASQQVEFAALEANLNNARNSLVRMTEEAREHILTITEITTERDTLDRRITKTDAEADALEARIEDLRKAKLQMGLEFNAIAGKLLESHSDTFQKQNEKQIGQLLSPLKTKIEEFEKGISTAHKESVKQHTELNVQINNLSEKSVEMSKETENLTRALKGKVQTQGAWGEMILETILQRSGLREGEEYTRQDSHIHDDGRRVRTDVIINLPNGEHLVIDAKVSLTDFEGFVNADTDVERSTRLSAHALSVKNHIKVLAGKEYHAAASGKLDFVIMFIPIEAALGAAMQQDGEIGFFAADNKVAISTPTTLTIALKTVAAIWRVERQNQNAAEIARRAGRLYDKFVGFLTDMGLLGTRIGQLQNTYDDAINKLSSGRGNLVWQVETLKEMGADTSKMIDPKYLEDDQSAIAAPSSSTNK